MVDVKKELDTRRQGMTVEEQLAHLEHAKNKKFLLSAGVWQKTVELLLPVGEQENQTKRCDNGNS